MDTFLGEPPPDYAPTTGATRANRPENLAADLRNGTRWFLASGVLAIAAWANSTGEDRSAVGRDAEALGPDEIPLSSLRSVDDALSPFITDS